MSKKNVAIQGQYFLDLSIPPAPQSVPVAVSGTENLSLHTTSGAVNADVWVTGNNKSQQVSIKLCSDNGNVHAKVVRLPLCIVQNFSNKTKPAARYLV